MKAFPREVLASGSTHGSQVQVRNTWNPLMSGSKTDDRQMGYRADNGPEDECYRLSSCANVVNVPNQLDPAFAVRLASSLIELACEVSLATNGLCTATASHRVFLSHLAQ